MLYFVAFTYARYEAMCRGQIAEQCAWNPIVEIRPLIEVSVRPRVRVDIS